MCYNIQIPGIAFIFKNKRNAMTIVLKWQNWALSRSRMVTWGFRPKCSVLVSRVFLPEACC